MGVGDSQGLCIWQRWVVARWQEIPPDLDKRLGWHSDVALALTQKPGHRSLACLSAWLVRLSALDRFQNTNVAVRIMGLVRSLSRSRSLYELFNSHIAVIEYSVVVVLARLTAVDKKHPAVLQMGSNWSTGALVESALHPGLVLISSHIFRTVTVLSENYKILFQGHRKADTDRDRHQ